MRDLVSILMPTKNVAKYIYKAVDSILTQTYENFELIIIDDSTDRTPEIINSFKDDRIKYHKLKGNISRALNFGIEIAKGKYIARMDGDDYCHQERLQKQIKIIEEKGFDVIGCNMCILKENGAFYENKIFPECNEDIKFYMPINTSLPHPTMFARKEVFEQIMYNEDLIYAEDMDLFLKLIENQFVFYNIQESLYFYRLTKDYYEANSKENSASYEIGRVYISNLLKTKGSPDLSRNMLKFALLEYYKGDLREARKYFLEYIRLNPEDKKDLKRYLLISKFHPFVLRTLRKFKIPQQFNKGILKYLKKDLQYSSKNTAD